MKTPKTDPKIETLPVEELIPYATNSRTHSDEQVAQIAASIREFGFTNPVLIDAEGTIIAGHGRVMAARKLALDTVPCIRLGHLTPAQVRAYVIADNKLALNAGWDEQMLKAELAVLKDEGFDVGLTGFSDDEIAALLADAGTDGAGTEKAAGSLSDKFGIPPFSVLNAREGWWQDRKREWLALGIKSEEGRGDGASPGGSPRPAADYSNKARGTGTGKTQMGGVLMKSWKSHPLFYPQKQAKEKDLGRELTTSEFIEKYFVPPTDDAYSSGTSIFDPVLCELSYRWFSPSGGTVIDPFAGGSVRGIVASKLGRQYVGHELRPEQVEANRRQASEICVEPIKFEIESQDNIPDLTPVEKIGDIWMKRDDAFCIGGGRGGKVRSCWTLSQGAAGLITAGSRSSPQVNIVAQIAKKLGIPCRVHTPTGELSDEVKMAVDAGAEIVQHQAGYNTVIVARAREDASATGWREIPFGMECQEAVEATASQVANIPPDVKRIVMPVGSGMSLAGVLTGLKRFKRKIPVLGVVVGADPQDRLNKYAPKDWESMVELVPAGMEYDHSPKETTFYGVQLDPIYESKCIRFICPGDLLWIVGLRASKAIQYQTKPCPMPVWIHGDSRNIHETCSDVRADMLMTCPPYADLEVYSDDPADLSTLGYSEFREAYSEIIRKACSLLVPDSFAVCVVGEVRDKTGAYVDFIGDTVQAFRDAGLAYYNEAILVTAVGSLPIRAGKQFSASRKLGKTHQNVLVFVKGDGKRAAARCGTVEVSEAIIAADTGEELPADLLE